MKFSLSSPKKPSAPKQNVSPSSPSQKGPNAAQTAIDADKISPELVPIVTLLSAQTHRRYHEGTFMLYNDLNGDGKPADREWREVYGILTGNQLAYWDAANLARFKNSPEQLFQTSSKPNYLNFTDAVFNAMKVLPAAKLQLENVLIVSTTLKNRFIIQLKTYSQLQEWTVALRLAGFEYQSLQEAYTGALLSARGSRLSDIRTVLAPKRFNHEDWVKIRYGSGMAWKRCFAVIEPSQTKRKSFVPGRVLLFESENTKKKALVGVITSTTSVSAVYPSSPFFIDQSTIMKLEGSINFKSPSIKQNKKNEANSQETSLFLMPENHSSVPGFDTLIRFLIPLYDAFGLYGRPQRLKADRVDPESLVFGLPTLPHVHYLNSTDLQGLMSSPQFLSWDARAWKENIKGVLRSKMAHGYDGCGSSRGFSGAVNSLNSPHLSSPNSPRVSSDSTTFQHPPAQQIANRSTSGPLPALKEPLSRGQNPGTPGTSSQYKAAPTAAYNGSHEQLPAGTLKAAAPSQNNRNVNNLEVKVSGDSRASVQLADIYHKYSTIETPSDQFDDRNKILNGSAEEIDEDVLPTLMRKKSLMHGPYPTSEKHLIDSESDIEESEEEDSNTEADNIRASGNFAKASEHAGRLAVPQNYDARSQSYSSVHSPLTQYNEFNRQFTKSVDHKAVSRLQPNNSDHASDDYDSGTDSYSDTSSAPPAPLHGSSSPLTPQGQAQQLPQIQQLQSLNSAKHYETQPLTPSSGENFYSEQTSHPANPRQDAFVQKSKATRNLNQSLESKGEVLNKPRYIQSPAASQNRSPRELGSSSGTFPQSEFEDNGHTQSYEPQSYSRSGQTSTSNQRHQGQAVQQSQPIQQSRPIQQSQPIQQGIPFQQGQHVYSGQGQQMHQVQQVQQGQQGQQGRQQPHAQPPHQAQPPRQTQQIQPQQARPSQQQQKFYDAPSHAPQYNQYSNAQQRPLQATHQAQAKNVQPILQAHPQRKPPSAQQTNLVIQPQQKPVPQQEQTYQSQQQYQMRSQIPQANYGNSSAAPPTGHSMPTRSGAGQMSQIQPHGGMGKPVYAGQAQPHGGHSQAQYQAQPQQQMAPQRVNPQQARYTGQPQVESQRPSHPYGARVTSNEQRPIPAQGFPLSSQPMQQPGQVVPSRPQAQSAQSASTIRSYGDQQYQYQVQQNYQPSQRPQQQSQASVQRPNGQNMDPRLQNQHTSQGYQRQY